MHILPLSPALLWRVVSRGQRQQKQIQAFHGRSPNHIQAAASIAGKLRGQTRIAYQVTCWGPAQVVLLLRLSPLVPYTLLSYTLGLTSVSFPAYVAASWAGMLPATFAYVSTGAAGRATLEGGASLGATRIALTVAGVGATLWASKILAGIAGDALSAADAELAAEAADLAANPAAGGSQGDPQGPQDGGGQGGAPRP